MVSLQLLQLFIDDNSSELVIYTRSVNCTMEWNTNVMSRGSYYFNTRVDMDTLYLMKQLCEFALC